MPRSDFNLPDRSTPPCLGRLKEVASGGRFLVHCCILGRPVASGAAYDDASARGHGVTPLDTEEPTSLGIGQFLGILRRRVQWVLLSVVVIAGVAYGVSERKAKQYTASAAVSFSNNSLSQQIAGLQATGGSSLEAQQASNVELVRLGDMAARTASLLGDGLTEESVRGSLDISARGETSIVEISATSSSPRLAAAIANTYVKQFVKEQQAGNRQFFKSALALVNKQLARLSPAQRVGSDGLDLQERAHTLALLAELGYDNTEVAQEASVPSSPSAPKPKSDTLLGAIAGLILGLGIALLRERLDRRIRGVKIWKSSTGCRCSALSRRALRSQERARLPLWRSRLSI